MQYFPVFSSPLHLCSLSLSPPPPFFFLSFLQALEQLRSAEKMASGALSEANVAKSQAQMEARQAREEAADLRLTLDALRASIDQEIKTRQEAEAALDGLRTQLTAAKAQLDATLVDKTGVDGLKSQLVAARKALDDEEEAHERDRVRAHEDMLALRAQINREKRRAESATTNLERRVQSLQARLDQDAQVIATAEATAKQLRDDNQRLHLQLSSAGEASDAQARLVHQLQAAAREKDRELAVLKTKNQMLQDDLARLQQQKLNLESRARHQQTRTRADMQRQMELNTQTARNLSMLRTQPPRGGGGGGGNTSDGPLLSSSLLHAEA